MLLQADAYKIPLPDQSVHCVVTSPPYWGLRKYSGEQGRIWGGDADCVHEWGELTGKLSRRKDNKELQANIKRAQERNYDVGAWCATEGAAKAFDRFAIPNSSFCQLCGAWYGGLGLEPTPELHIQNMVSIFREIKRVLRDDGVVWLNYGDCYAGSGGENTNYGLRREGEIRKTSHTEDGTRSGLWRRNPRKEKIKQGNLMLMPHRVAIALQDDGWIVRNDLIWFKRNPMPESVAGWRWEKSRTKKGRSQHAKEHNIKGGTEAMLRDASIHQGIGPHWCPEWEYGDDYVLRKGSWRHTRAHEYIFQLIKGMNYYSNQEAVREQSFDPRVGSIQPAYNDKIIQDTGEMDHATRIGLMRERKYSTGRNPRSVLDVPTAPYKGAHYATFPPNLIAPLIRASCPCRSCPECGQAWAPVVEKTDEYLSKLRRPNMSAIGPQKTGDYILFQREKLNKSRAELAKFFPHYKNEDSIKAQFSNWELGKNVPSQKDWHILKEILNLDNRFDEQIELYHYEQVGGWHTDEGQPLEIGKSKRGESISTQTNVSDYRPTCSHNHDPIPGIVLDPFIGSGTTGAVARELQRHWIGLDISMDYIDQQAKVRALKWTPSNALDDLPLFRKGDSQ